MRKISVLPLFFILAVTIGCSKRATAPQPIEKQTLQRDSSDNTIYALTCEGTGDSALVYLTVPYEGQDPDTLNILEARRNRQVFGRPHVGDMVAIVRNDSNAIVADRVIVTEELCGQWSYTVYPTLRRHFPSDTLPKRLRELLEQPREYSMVIKKDYVMYCLGPRRQPSDDMSPVVYPPLRHFTQWNIYNGRLLFTETARDTTDSNNILSVDTAELVKLRHDTLVLRFSDGEHSYYRKVKK